MDASGYFWVILRDRNQVEPFEKFNIPLHAFKDFQPIHLEVICRNQMSDQKTKVYLSLCLERPTLSSVDSLANVVVNWAEFQPLPGNCKKFSLMMTTDSFAPKDVPYMQCDLG